MLDLRMYGAYVQPNNGHKPPNERQDMKQTVIEVSDLDSIVLTSKGRVIGYVRVKECGGGGDFEFVGRAVNVLDYPNVTYHGFACSNAITTEDANEVANVESFNEAMALVGVK